MSRISTLHDFLRDAHVPYAVVPHRPAFTAQQEAAATHIPARDWAKVVVCFIDGEPVEAVIPATTFVNLDRLLELADGGTIRVADEDELQHLFPDCELGAMPPFGNLYGLDTYVTKSLADDEEIAFNSGTHTEVIRMPFRDFERVVHPRPLVAD